MAPMKKTSRIDLTKKVLLGLGMALVLMLVMATGVFADGTKTEKVCTTYYGGGEICDYVTEEFDEEVTRETEFKDTGIVENVLVAGVLFSLGYGVLWLARRETRALLN